ncbi:MAG: efflux transporter outer membrane subunit [Massilia sp.]
MRRSLPPLLLALALAGCAHVPADTAPPAAPDFARAQHAATIKLAREGWPEARWWSAFHDTQLDALIAQALAGNPTLAVAQARLAVAGAALRAEQASGGGALGLDAGLNRQRYSGNGLFPEPIGGNFYNDASVQIRAAYDFDWWGKQRALVAAALGEVNASRADYSVAEKTLAGAVAHSYFKLQAVLARIDNVHARQALLAELTAARAARVRQGLATIDEQRGAERELALLGEEESRLATLAAREREALRALSAGGSEAAPVATHRLPDVEPALPAQLGMELLARRPDLQAARWRVEASLGRIDASRAAFYPDINLAGAVGLDAVSLSRLLQANSLTMLAGATLRMPLFDSSRLNIRIEQARLQRNALMADYNRRVLDAVRDVAEEGATLQGIGRQVAANGATRKASAALLDATQKRFAHQLGDRPSLLQAKLEMLRQDDSALQLRDAALQTQLALIDALGGGYRQDPQQTASTNSSHRTIAQ